MTTTFPDFEPQVRDLVDQHRKLKKPRLLLAVYFAASGKARHDICLFEVIDGFGGNTVGTDGKLFEFKYGSTPAFPVPPDSSLAMVLTNPVELALAICGNWKGIDTLRRARKADQAIVIYSDDQGKRLWDKIQ